MNIPMQPTPIKYALVQETSGDTFEQHINRLLDQGYVLHGPSQIDGRGMFTQPMVMLEMRPIRMTGMDSAILPIDGSIVKR